jgi:hypothetical protein
MSALHTEDWPDKCDRCIALKLSLHKTSDDKTGQIRTTILSSRSMLVRNVRHKEYVQSDRSIIDQRRKARKVKQNCFYFVNHLRIINQ